MFVPMQYEDAGTWDEENELRVRKEAGDIVCGDDPRRPPLIPKGHGRYAQEFWGVYDPSLYTDTSSDKAEVAAYLAAKTAKEISRRVSLMGSSVGNIMDGVSYLNFVYDAVLNTHIVLASGRAGIENHDKAAELVWKLLHRVRKWFARRGLEAFYVYVHENSQKHGFHTHLLLHVGGDVWPQFRKWFPKAVEYLWGHPLPDRLLHIGHRRQRNFSHQVMLQWIWVRYLLKGIEPELGLVSPINGEVKSACEVLRLRPRPGGLVLCRKRAGVSSNIGRRVRDKAGYLSLFAQGQDDRLFDGDEFRLRAELLVRQEAEKMRPGDGVALGGL